MNTELTETNSVDNAVSSHDALSESDKIKQMIDEEIRKKLGVRYETSDWINVVIDNEWVKAIALAFFI